MSDEFVQEIAQRASEERFTRRSHESALMAVRRGMFTMQLCPICGITREEQSAQRALAHAEFRLLYARWKQRNNPTEPAPGLPVTDEYRVHYALWLYQNDPSKEPKASVVKWAAQKAGVDSHQVAQAVDHITRT